MTASGTDDAACSSHFLNRCQTLSDLVDPIIQERFNLQIIMNYFSPYVILDGDSLASIGLYAAAPTPILNDLMVHFDPPTRYMYQGFTQVAYRGKRLHALGILRAAQELFDRQVPQLVTVCEKTNYPATISVHRMGWKACGTLYRVGVGPWSRLGRTSAASDSGMRLEFRSAGRRE